MTTETAPETPITRWSTRPVHNPYWLRWGYEILRNGQVVARTHEPIYRTRDEALSAGQDAWLHLLTGHADNTGIGDEYEIL